MQRKNVRTRGGEKRMRRYQAIPTTLFHRCLVQCFRLLYCYREKSCNVRHGGIILQHCTACGTQIPDNARFCRNCGYILNPSNVDTVKVNPRKKSSKKTSKDRRPLADLTT